MPIDRSGFIAEHYRTIVDCARHAVVRNGGAIDHDEIAHRVVMRLLNRNTFDPTRGSVGSFIRAVIASEINAYIRGERRLKSRQDVARRSGTVYDASPDWPAFTAKLTHREQEFLRAELINDPIEITPANRWQLTHRIKRKLESAL